MALCYCYRFSLHIFSPQHSIWCVHSNQFVMFTICIYLPAQGRTIQMASTLHHHQQHYNEHCHAFTRTDPLEFQGTHTQENTQVDAASTLISRVAVDLTPKCPLCSGSAHPHQGLTFYWFMILASVQGVDLNFTVVLIYISLINNELERLFIFLLSFWVSSSLNCV